MFDVTSGVVRGHIERPEGIAVDPGKIKAIIEALTLKNAKALSHFMRQMRWHSQMLHYLANFATPLHGAIHRTSFSWSEMEDKVYMALKFMLTQAPVVHPSDWM